MRQRLDELESRSQAFATACVDVSVRLDAVRGLEHLARQLNQAALSVGANHRAMRRARSLREFAAKLQIVNEEIDEAVYWLEIASRRRDPPRNLNALLREARELRAIFARARATTREKLKGAR